MSGHQDVAVVGQDDDLIGRQLGDRLIEILGARVHRLAAGHDDMRAQAAEDVRQAFARRNHDDTGTVNGGERAGIGVRDRRAA